MTYYTGSKLQLPIKSAVEEFKTTKVRAVMMLRDSQDERLASVDKRRGLVQKEVGQQEE